MTAPIILNPHCLAVAVISSSSPFRKRLREALILASFVERVFVFENLTSFSKEDQPIQAILIDKTVGIGDLQSVLRTRDPVPSVILVTNNRFIPAAALSRLIFAGVSGFLFTPYSAGTVSDALVSALTPTIFQSLKAKGIDFPTFVTEFSGLLDINAILKRNQQSSDEILKKLGELQSVLQVLTPAQIRLFALALEEFFNSKAPADILWADAYYHGASVRVKKNIEKLLLGRLEERIRMMKGTNEKK